MPYLYSRVDFILRSSETPSQFDTALHSTWTEAYEQGKFRYRLSFPIAVRRISDSPLNPTIVVPVPNRFSLRRAPMEVYTLDDPVTGFNFTKIGQSEILLTVAPCDEQSTENQSMLAINISPFAFLHSLLVPQPLELFNQRLRKSALTAAVECFLLSGNALLCMGFNSLLALASVNHLHFHLWQSPEPVYAMTATPTAKPRMIAYSELAEHPVHNFVLELTSLDNLNECINSIWRVVEVCHSLQIAYNVLLCRATTNEGFLRAILWPRRSVYGAKPLITEESPTDFHIPIAVAELAGMIVVPSEKCGLLISLAQFLDTLRAERLPDSVIRNMEDMLIRGAL